MNWTPILRSSVILPSTSPTVFNTTASSNSPIAGSPVRKNAMAPQFPIIRRPMGFGESDRLTRASDFNCKGICDNEAAMAALREHRDFLEQGANAFWNGADAVVLDVGSLTAVTRTLFLSTFHPPATKSSHVGKPFSFSTLKFQRQKKQSRPWPLIRTSRP